MYVHIYVYSGVYIYVYIDGIYYSICAMLKRGIWGMVIHPTNGILVLGIVYDIYNARKMYHCENRSEPLWVSLSLFRTTNNYA